MHVFGLSPGIPRRNLWFSFALGVLLLLLLLHVLLLLLLTASQERLVRPTVKYIGDLKKQTNKKLMESRGFTHQFDIVIVPANQVTFLNRIKGEDLSSQPVHEISYNAVCVTNKASDQPAHTRSLIRAFASRLSIL